MKHIKSFRNGWKSVHVFFDGEEYSVEEHDLYHRSYVNHIKTKRKALAEARRLIQ